MGDVTDEELAEMNSKLETALDVIYCFLDHVWPVPPYDGSRVFYSFLSVCDELAEKELRLQVVRAEPSSGPWSTTTNRPRWD